MVPNCCFAFVFVDITQEEICFMQELNYYFRDIFQNKSVFKILISCMI